MRLIIKLKATNINSAKEIDANKHPIDGLYQRLDNKICGIKDLPIHMRS